MDMVRNSKSKPWYKFGFTSLLPLRMKNQEIKIPWKTPRKMMRSNTDINVSVIILLM